MLDIKLQLKRCKRYSISTWVVISIKLRKVLAAAAWMLVTKADVVVLSAPCADSQAEARARDALAA